MPELLRSHDKTVTNEEFLFMDFKENVITLEIPREFHNEPTYIVLTLIVAITMIFKSPCRGQAC